MSDSWSPLWDESCGTGIQDLFSNQCHEAGGSPMCFLSLGCGWGAVALQNLTLGAFFYLSKSTIVSPIEPSLGLGAPPRNCCFFAVPWLEFFGYGSYLWNIMWLLGRSVPRMCKARRRVRRLLGQSIPILEGMLSPNRVQVLEPSCMHGCRRRPKELPPDTRVQPLRSAGARSYKMQHDAQCTPKFNLYKDSSWI